MSRKLSAVSYQLVDTGAEGFSCVRAGKSSKLNKLELKAER
jgi:hypothetical protein